MSALELHDAGLAYGSRQLWSGLDLTVEPGEFLAVLGANGSGKTSLLRAILGLQPLTHGTVRVDGQAPRKASRAIGYVPQHRRIDPSTPLRGKDAVRLGLDGHRWGPGWLRGADRDRITNALTQVEATAFAEAPIGELSGGEQQRIRIAQAVVSDPSVLLCDEPLLTLDLASQRTITGLIDRRRRTHRTAVLFVTHEINPVLPYVDRVLYLAGGQFRVGTVDEVLTGDTLSSLYGTAIEVVRRGNRILVAGLPEQPEHAHDHCLEPEGPLG